MLNVKTLGAFGDGKLPDLRQIREALRIAGEHPAGATVYFPPGEYYLGAADHTYLLNAKNLQNVRFVGERATLSCRSVNDLSGILVLEGARNIAVEGLAFRDYGLKQDINLGAVAIRLGNNEAAGCENIAIRDCRFDSVMSAVVCRNYDERARTRGITLTNLSVNRAYYGFNFQDSGDDVVGRGLRCNDVRRSYFPYGVSNHDIELEAGNNTSGFTDVLIGCTLKDTSNIRVKVKYRGKPRGDSPIRLDHLNETPNKTIRNIKLDVDIDDLGCDVDAAIVFRAVDPKTKRSERVTNRRWEAISIDGNVRICNQTKLFEFQSIPRTPGTLHIGPRLARNPRLPKNFPGFVVEIDRS